MDTPILEKSFLPLDPMSGKLFFSAHMQEKTKRSDVDICLGQAFKGDFGENKLKLDGKYDIEVFENLPLYLKIEVIENGRLIYGNEIEKLSYPNTFTSLESYGQT